MVRVLVVTNWYPPHHFGGYELSCFDVMTGLERRGHEAHVLCGDTDLGPDRVAPDRDHESRVRRELRLYHTGDALLRPSWPRRLGIERHNQRALARALRDVQPDVVSIWQLGGLSQGLLDTIRRARLPVVFAICDEWLVYGIQLDPWARAFQRTRLRRILGRLVRSITGVPCVVPDISDLGTYLFVTRSTETLTLEKSRWRPLRRAVVWSGIDRRVFDGPAARPKPWSWRLITTGRFDPRKGFETLVRALPLLPVETTAAVWGRGGDAERERLSGIARELGVDTRISFGSLDREQLPDAYRAADVMVFPSTWAEPFGLVPIEAMACGVPVVATGMGGSAEFLVDGVNCLLFRAGDADDLAAVISRLAADPALRDRLVTAGLRTADELDIERLIDDMEAWHVYEAGGRRGPPPPPRPAPAAAVGASADE